MKEKNDIDIWSIIVQKVDEIFTIFHSFGFRTIYHTKRYSHIRLPRTYNPKCVNDYIMQFVFLRQMAKSIYVPSIFWSYWSNLMVNLPILFFYLLHSFFCSNHLSNIYLPPPAVVVIFRRKNININILCEDNLKWNMNMDVWYTCLY